ncbi:hypothetical protein AB0442_27550 [Kitasatospora sp. NPDC085895]|uniref:hypothetical protein n=1 Tax=Kitasatospora sp. NPDC085895 TaxID=3155057 RepID=UPI00345031B8
MLAAPSPVARRVLEVTQADQVLPLYPDLEQALHHPRTGEQTAQTVQRGSGGVQPDRHTSSSVTLLRDTAGPGVCAFTGSRPKGAGKTVWADFPLR